MARKRIKRVVRAESNDRTIDQKIVDKYIQLYNCTVAEAWRMINRKRMFNELPE